MTTQELIAVAALILWLFTVLITFFFLLQRYTLGNWTEDNPNPYKRETLGMPRGTIRSLVVLSLLFVVVCLEFLNLGSINTEIRKELLIAFQMVLAFYFGSKILHHAFSTDQRRVLIQQPAPQVPSAEEEN